MSIQLPFRTASVQQLVLAALAFTLSLVGAGAASAERCQPDAPPDVCRFLVGGVFEFEARRDDVHEGSAADRFEVVGDLTLQTPGGPLPLAEAVASFWEGPGGIIWPDGAFARAPIGALLGQVGIEFDAAPLTYFGLASRDELRDLLENPEDPGSRLPLAENEDPERPGELLEPSYLFFHAERGIDLTVPLPLPTAVTGGEPAGLPLSRKQVVTLILDPQDPYFYISNLGANGIIDKIVDKTRKRDIKKKLRKQARADKKAARKAARQDGKKPSKKDKKKTKKKKSKKDKKAPKGALGFSWLGGIPFDPIAVPAPAAGLLEELPWLGELDGHLYVRGPSPMGPFVVMDGSTVTGLLDDGVVMGGFGEAELTLPYIGQMLSFGFPLGDAVAALSVSGDVQEVALRGTLDPSTDFLPKVIPIQADAFLDVEAVLGTDLDRTHVTAHGAFVLDAKTLGKQSGASLAKMEVEGDLHMDGRGFHLRGVTSQSLHPAIGASSAIRVEASFTGNPAEDFVLLQGALSVSGVALGSEATLLIDGSGVYVAGEFVTGISRIALEGEIGRGGPRLEGTGEVEIAATAAVASAQAAVGRAQAVVNGLEDDLEALRAQVRRERLEASAKWRAARDDVDAAKRAVSSLEGDIDDVEDDIDDEKAALRSCKIGLGYAGCVAHNAPILVRIGGLETKLAGLETSLFGAKNTLRTASKALALIESAILAAPIDADVRIIALLVSLEAAQVTLTSAEDALASVPKVGVIEATLHVVLDRKGIRGTATAAAEGLTIASADVDFTPEPEVCVMVAGQGELCAAF